jgi:hypothetical protein
MKTMSKVPPMRVKCVDCSYVEVFADSQKAKNARDFHEFDTKGHVFCLQHPVRGKRWATLTTSISLDAEGRRETIEYPRPELRGLTAVDISL